jgi:hypothetical protein
VALLAVAAGVELGAEGVLAMTGKGALGGDGHLSHETAEQRDASASAKALAAGGSAAAAAAAGAAAAAKKLADCGSAGAS